MVVGGGISPMLGGIFLSVKVHVHSLGIHLDPESFLDVQVMMMANFTCYQLRLVERKDLAMLIHSLVTSGLTVYILCRIAPEGVLET